jgi:predicted  nucleic acid-binding Zn-ribbon protein
MGKNNKSIKFSERINEYNQYHNGIYDYSLVDQNSYPKFNQKIPIKCKKHGIFYQGVSDHKKSGCPQCGKERISTYNKKSNEEWIKEFISAHKDNYGYHLIKGNICSEEKIPIYCNKHKEVFYQIPSRHIEGHGCPQCGYDKMSNKLSLTKDELQERINRLKINGDEYEIIEYNGLQHKSLIKHKKCNNVYYQRLDGFLYKDINCPICNQSKGELRIAYFLKKYSIKYQPQLIVDKFRFDFYLPDYDLYAEYDGIQHFSPVDKFGGEEAFKKQVIRDKEKNEYCKANNLKLIRIPYYENYQLKLIEAIFDVSFFHYEWINKKEICQSLLNSKIGKCERVFARKCEIKEINIKEANIFYVKNHLQGRTHASINIGLFCREKIFSCLSFNKPQYEQKYEWEIMRYATELNVQVVGGFSKMLSHFVKTYEPKNILTYANARYSTGNVYKKNGFKFLHKSNSNYWYIKDGIKLSRISCQKHKLPKLLGDKFNPKLSERENMINSGYDIIKDKGNYVFLKE